MTTNNDISDNSRILKKTNQIPYFVYRGGQLVLDDSFKDTKQFKLRRSVLGSLGAWMMKHLRVSQAGAHALYVMEHGDLTLALNDFNGLEVKASAVGLEDVGQPVPREELGIDSMVYLAPKDPVWNDAWRVTEGLITLMRDEVKRKGAMFVVVTLSNWIQVHPDVDGRQAFIKRIGGGDLFYPDRRIKSLCQSEGILAITLAPALQAYVDQHQVFLHGFGAKTGGGHWNQLGHRVAGEMLAVELCDIVRDAH